MLAQCEHQNFAHTAMYSRCCQSASQHITQHIERLLLSPFACQQVLCHRNTTERNALTKRGACSHLTHMLFIPDSSTHFLFGQSKVSVTLMAAVRQLCREITSSPLAGRPLSPAHQATGHIRQIAFQMSMSRAALACSLVAVTSTSSGLMEALFIHTATSVQRASSMHMTRRHALLELNAMGRHQRVDTAREMGGGHGGFPVYVGCRQAVNTSYTAGDTPLMSWRSQSATVAITMLCADLAVERFGCGVSAIISPCVASAACLDQCNVRPDACRSSPRTLVGCKEVNLHQRTMCILTCTTIVTPLWLRHSCNIQS